MLAAKLKLVVALMLFVVGITWFSSAASPQATAAEPKETRLKQLLKERLETRRQVAAIANTQYQQGTVDFGLVHQATQALIRAELDLCDSDKERIAVLEKLIDQLKEGEKMVDRRFQAGALGTTKRDVLMAKADRLEIEIDLERLKAKAQDRPK